MTFENRDPELNRTVRRPVPDNTMMWVGGAVALLLIGGFIFLMSNDTPTIASNDTRPAVTTPATTSNSPATTTGSGSSAVRPVQPTNPAGNVPTTTPSGSPAR